MDKIRFWFGLGVFGIGGALQAAPITLQNGDYQVILAQTLPGLDDQATLQVGPTIAVTVVDKFHDTQTVYPLNVYDIENYSLSDNDLLDLFCRTSSRAFQNDPRYTLLQLSLPNGTDSREFQPLKFGAFSPDDQAALVVLDGSKTNNNTDGTSSDPIGWVRLSEAPASLQWIDAGPHSLLGKLLPPDTQAVSVQSPIGWSGDSAGAVFLATVQESPSSAQSQAASQDYLVNVREEGDDLKVGAENVDLSPQHYHQGSVLTQVRYAPDKVTLLFSQADSSDILQADFPLPQPPNP